MKNSIYILIIAVFAIFGCEGPEGPMGPAGYDGIDGQDGLDGEEGYTFDYENVDFTEANDYTVSLPFPDNFQMLESDVVLVYMHEGYDDISGNDIWRSLPIIELYNEGGYLQYEYDFTIDYVRIYLYSDLSVLDEKDKIVRIVVVPAQFGARTDIDYNNYEEVAAHFNLKPFNQK